MREPSEPSANVLSQPSRSRSSGSGPNGDPLRSPARPAAASWSARMLAWTRRRQHAGGGQRSGRPRAARPGHRAAPWRPGRARRRRRARAARWRAGRARRRSIGPSGAGRARSRGSRPDSCRTPVGRPVASRRITPPAGSARRSSTPASTSAAGLATSAWWSWAQSATSRPGAARSRSSAVGHRPRASGSHPPPSIQASPSPACRRRARRPPRGPGATSSSIDAQPSSSTRDRSSAASARCRWASVRPGIATSSSRSSQAARPGTGQARDVVRPPGGDHPALADRDRLGPRRAHPPPRASRSCRPPPGRRSRSSRVHGFRWRVVRRGGRRRDRCRRRRRRDAEPSASSADSPARQRRVLDPGGHRDGDRVERPGRRPCRRRGARWPRIGPRRTIERSRPRSRSGRRRSARSWSR